jgi:hypothetical protein
MYKEDELARKQSQIEVLSLAPSRPSAVPPPSLRTHTHRQTHAHIQTICARAHTHIYTEQAGERAQMEAQIAKLIAQDKGLLNSFSVALSRIDAPAMEGGLNNSCHFYNTSHVGSGRAQEGKIVSGEEERRGRLCNGSDDVMAAQIAGVHHGAAAGKAGDHVQVVKEGRDRRVGGEGEEGGRALEGEEREGGVRDDSGQEVRLNLEDQVRMLSGLPIQVSLCEFVLTLAYL